MDFRTFSKKSFQIPMALICLLLSFAITWQVRGVYKRTIQGAQQTQRYDQLLEQYLEAVAEKIDALTQLEECKQDLEEYREAVSQSSDASARLLRDVEKFQMMAGRTDVEGSGVIITVTDGAPSPELGILYNPNDYLIHNEDMLFLLSELKAAGVDALSINGERILANSEVRCNGPTISVNRMTYAAPYEVKAIGDPDNIISALNFPRGVKERFETFGLGFTVKKADNVVINGYKREIYFNYAKPVKKEGEE